MKHLKVILVLAAVLTLYSSGVYAQTNDDFVVKKIDFIKMSTVYTRVRGEIINNSKVNIRQAEFMIHVFNKEGKLINSANFSIRNLVIGVAKSFNAVVKANAKHIESYKLELKSAREIPPAP